MVKEVVPNCEVIITGEHGSDSRTYRVDFNKIKNELPNFNPKWNLRKGIEQIYEYYQKYGMDSNKFNGRYFIRLKQLQYLIKNKKLDTDLYWL